MSLKTKVFITLTLVNLAALPVYSQQSSVPNKPASEKLTFQDFILAEEAKVKELQVNPIAISPNEVMTTSDFQLELNKLKLSGGGWNGSGGGGGAACFEDEAIKNWQLIANLDKSEKGSEVLTKPGIPYIKSFLVLDVADSVISVELPKNGNYSEIIKNKIRSRIGKTLPVFSNHIIRAYDRVRNLPVHRVEFLEIKSDIGPSTVGGLRQMPCVYAQWILRLHDSRSATPRYELFINNLLDLHLRKILSPEYYALQKEILYLHEAIYGLFLHTTNVETSQPTRALVQLIVADETSYNRELGSKYSTYSNLFWSVWVQRNIIMALDAGSHYKAYLEATNAPRESKNQWNDYLNFLKVVDAAPIESFAEAFKKQFPGTVIRIPYIGDPAEQQYDVFVRFFMANHLYVLEADAKGSKKDLFGAYSFFLLANDLHARGMIWAPESWIAEPAKKSLQYKAACLQIKMMLDTPKSSEETVREIEKYLERNIQNALLYCNKLRVK